MHSCISLHANSLCCSGGLSHHVGHPLSGPLGCGLAARPDHTNMNSAFTINALHAWGTSTMACTQPAIPLTRQHMPDHSSTADLPVPVMCYEQLLDEAAESGELLHFSWPRLDENSPAGLCYTSGTTGNPKASNGNLLICSRLGEHPLHPWG